MLASPRPGHSGGQVCPLGWTLREGGREERGKERYNLCLQLKSVLSLPWPHHSLSPPPAPTHRIPHPLPCPTPPPRARSGSAPLGGDRFYGPRDHSGAQHRVRGGCVEVVLGLYLPPAYPHQVPRGPMVARPWVGAGGEGPEIERIRGHSPVGNGTEPQLPGPPVLGRVTGLRRCPCPNPPGP